MKKRVILLIFSLLVIACLWVYSHVINFMYVCPYTETSGMKNISKVVMLLEKTMNRAKWNALIHGVKFNHVFSNAYGSGFIKNNPIPNDLDYEVLIDIGTFDYSKNNDSIVLASDILNKMESFVYYLLLDIENSKDKNFYSMNNSWAVKPVKNSKHYMYVNDIAAALDNALSGEKYVDTSTKVIGLDGNPMYYMPYVVNPGNVIVRDSRLVILYSDLVSYNKFMPKYMRVVSIALNFQAKIKHNGKISYVRFIPESYNMGLLDPIHRMYVPNIFIGNHVQRYIKELYSFSDEDLYLKNLWYCYADHLKVIYEKDAYKLHPIKVFKRIIQLTDMMAPVLGEKESQEIYEYAASIMNNRDIQLLNEYINILDFLGRTIKSKNLYSVLKNDNKVSDLIKTLENVVSELKARGNVKSEDMKVLEEYLTKDVYNLINLPDISDAAQLQKDVQDEKYNEVITPLVSDIIFYNIHDHEKLQSIVTRLKNIYDNSGAKFMYLYPAGADTFIVEKNEFTDSIKDFKDFAYKNDLAPNMKFKVLPKEQIPANYLKYRAFVRYNTTKAQDEYYEKVKNILLENRDEFKIRQKRYFVW